MGAVLLSGAFCLFVYFSFAHFVIVTMLPPCALILLLGRQKGHPTGRRVTLNNASDYRANRVTDYKP